MRNARSILLAIACLTVALGNARAETDWSSFIEAELAREGVPGAAVVVIREHKVVWSKGFGVANALTGERVEADTAFPAASNGKPMAAWIAVQMAARGELDLDRPVFGAPGVMMPDTTAHRRITPRHLLTHSSGLGNFLRDTRRALAFAPGERFAYSGVGFMVLQELIEGKTGRPFDATAQAQLFVPLGMGRSWFETPTAAATSIAPPHVTLTFALAPFSIVAAGAFVVLTLIAFAVQRLVVGSWRLRRATWLVVVALTVLAGLVVLYQFSGSWQLTLWFAGVPMLLLAATAAIAALGARVFGRDRVTRGGIVALVLLLAAAAVVLRGETRLPLPVQTGGANAASSLYASAGDLAAFMIELARPSLGDAGATTAMTTALERIDDVASWGLGIGVERHARGRDLWQWGSNPGAKSLMIVSPEIGDGVVILTNGESDGELTRRLASRILGREGCWRAGCAAR